METKVKEPIYIGGVPTYDLYLEKYPHQYYLYVNGVYAKALSLGPVYQMNEPTLFEYFDEICALFNDDVYIVIDDISYLPLSIQVNGKYVFTIEHVGTTFIMNSELGLNDIRNISNKIESIFKNKIIPLLKKVGLHG
jgi:beta-galactosidase/beta-glucuronidase